MSQSISILALSVVAAEALTVQRFVTATGAQAAAGGNSYGVVRSDADAGEQVTVDVLGTAVVESGGEIATGDRLEVDADGRAVTQDTGTAVAIAVEPANVAGRPVEVFLLSN